MPGKRKDPREWTPVNLLLSSGEQGLLRAPWEYIVSNPSSYPPEIFAQVVQELIFHPERNSKNIRRADILFDSDTDPGRCTDMGKGMDGMLCMRTIRRRLMPRNPNLDAELEQSCGLYIVAGDTWPTLVTYHNHFLDNIGVPYYMPDVLGIAFELYDGKVYLAYLRGSEQSCTDDRLWRVALSLLRTLHRHCLGTFEGYQKRVHHDVLVNKSEYQDLYISLKNKYAKHLIHDWVEKTDPLKHVFEDISIAAFLILLWHQDRGQLTKFVDIGCGNGVLVYLLTMEGYTGYGFDARRRKSWLTFPPHVQERLHEKILIPHFLAAVRDDSIHDGKFEDNTFLISNHADELTPYTPLLAALTHGSGFLAIPCCEHDFSGAKVSGGLLSRVKGVDDVSARGKRYGMYCEWVREISRQSGWSVEGEMLRIPSTRNVGIVGRHIEHIATKDEVVAVISRMGGHDGAKGFVERARGLADRVSQGH